MTPPRAGRRGARGRTRTPDARLRKPALCPLSYARWCSLTSSRRDARRPGALGGSRTPVSASVERRRVRWTTKAVLFTAGARQMRADGDGAEWQHDKCTLLERIHAQEKSRPGDVPGRPVVRRCGQTTGPPESPARNEDTLRYATGSTTRGCSQGSTGRRRSCWTGSRTALLLSVMSGGPRTGMSSTEEDRTRLSRSTQPHFRNSTGIPWSGPRGPVGGPPAAGLSCPSPGSCTLRARKNLRLPALPSHRRQATASPVGARLASLGRRLVSLGTLFLRGHTDPRRSGRTTGAVGGTR